MEEDDAEASDQSEFNSDAEEVEFGLYASLYFEPNPDFLPVKDINSTKNGNQTKNICAESVSDLPHKIGCQPKNVICDTIVDNELNRNVKKGDNPDKDEDEEENNQTKSAAEIQRSGKDFNDKVNKEVGHNDIIRNQSMEKNVKRGSDYINKIDAQNQIKYGPGDDAEYEKRVRQSSICSVDSIAGNTKLDALYTVNISSSDEDEYQEALDSKLAINNIIIKDNKEKKTGITSMNKRKRDVKESDSIGSDDNEDSKCHIMSIAVKKKKFEKGSKKIYNEIDSSESDSDIHVLPPSPKQFETLDVSSEAESESHKNIIENIEENVSKDLNNSDLGSVKSTAKLLKSKKLKPQSSEIPKKGMLLSIDDYSNKSKSKKQKKAKEKKSSKDCIIISEDSDDSLDILEISKGTELVMNLGGGLNSFIERPDTKKTKEKKKKKCKKGDGFSNVDYTQGRQLTTKIPSCKKWTLEMTTFYDSDISEDLEVEDIHAQQSDSPLLWNIIPRDYPVRGRRRYFNQEARCKRCRQFGHEEKNCPRVPRCHLCSKTDHVVRYQCPNNCCFRCGGEPHSFCQNTLNTTICELCGWPGHNTNLCPDLWRRFHITTSGNDPQPPVLLSNTLRPRSEAYCYCCARKGHFGHECPDRHQIRSCVPVAQSVVSYAPPVLQREGEKVINLEGIEVPLEEAAYNPVTKIKIQMKDGGRIVGKSGVIVKDIERRTGAKVNIVTKKGKQMVCVYGHAEAREAAKNLVEVLLEKRAPDGHESFVMHVAKINSSPSVLNILKKSPGSQGKKSPNIIKETNYDYSPNVVSSKRELNKEDMYQKNDFIKISQERNLFNETQRKGLKEDESLKEDFLSLNKTPRRRLKEDESLKEDFSSSNKTPRKRLKEDDSLKEDFLSLNTKSKLFMVREDQKSPSSITSDQSLSINDRPHENFWNLKTLKKKIEQSCQLGHDPSLKRDFLSLKTPKRIRKTNDDMQILESPTGYEDKSRKVNKDSRWNDYFIEDLVDEPSNKENELLKTTRLALEEQIDNLGIQVTFMSRLRQNLPRNKRLLLEQSKDLLARIDSMDYDIPSLVNKITKNRKIFTQANPAFQQKKWLKKNLQMVSMVVIGQERLGSGVNLRRTLDCLLKEVKAYKGKAPQQFVTEISETFKQICDPSVKKMDEILRLAKTYMQRYPQGKSNVSAYDASSKKEYKMQKEVSKEKKKKKINDQGKSKKLKSPRRFIKINKNVAKDFGAMSSKSAELNRKPKKNKKKKLKIRTKEGKRNWNAVFNNS